MPRFLKIIGVFVLVIGVVFAYMIFRVANPPHPNAYQKAELEDLVSVVLIDIVGLARADLEGYELGEWNYKSIPDYHAQALVHLKVDSAYLQDFVANKPCIREGWCWSELSSHEHPMDKRYSMKFSGTISRNRGYVPDSGGIPSVTEIEILPFRKSVYFYTEAD